MANFLFLSPLGWTHHVWDLVVDFPSIKDNWTSLEFLEISFPTISKDTIRQKIATQLDTLESPKIVIAASFGVPVLLDYLQKHPTQLNALILIEGFDEIPDLQQLPLLFENQKETFSTQEAYLDEMVGSDSPVGEEVASILFQNLQKEGSAYRVRLGNQAAINYLGLYSGFDSQEALLQVVNQTEKVILFSHIPLTLPHHWIHPQDHLLMLTQPEQLKEILSDFFD